MKSIKRVLILLGILAIVFIGFGTYNRDTTATPEAILSGINTERTNKHLTPLLNDPELARDAQKRAEGLCNVALTHDSYQKELDESKYPYTIAGENLAEGNYSSEIYVESWINSPSHYENIIKPEYKQSGIGIAECGHKRVIVQWFATKQ